MDEKKPRVTPQWINTVEQLCIVMICFTAYLFLFKRTTILAAVIFRVSVLLIGTIGYIAIQIAKRRK